LEGGKGFVKNRRRKALKKRRREKLGRCISLKEQDGFRVSRENRALVSLLVRTEEEKKVG